MPQIEGTIWSATVDNERFTVAVWPIEGRTHVGTLKVTVNDTDEELLSDEVTVAFNAIFGADVADLAVWQEAAIDVIDEWLTAHGEAIPEPPQDEGKQ